MTFQLAKLPLIGLSRNKFLKDSGMDEFEAYEPGPDEIYDPEVYSEGDAEPVPGADDASLSYEETDTPYDDESNPEETGGAVQNDDGSWSYTDDQGNEYYEDTEGNTMVTYADGGGIAYLSDGSTYEWDADGNEVKSTEEEEPASLGNPGEYSSATGDRSTARGKAAQLAQGAIDAANKITGKNPSAAAPKTTPAILRKTTMPTGIKTATTKTNLLSSLSIGTVLALGAAGVLLYSLNKKKGK